MIAAWCSLAPQHCASQMSERVCATCRLSPISGLMVAKDTLPVDALEDSKDSAYHSAVLEFTDGLVSFGSISFEIYESGELRACAFTCWTEAHMKVYGIWKFCLAAQKMA